MTQLIVGVLTFVFGASVAVGQSITRKTAFKGASGSPFGQGFFHEQCINSCLPHE